ncbi:MAG: hypothetical protein QF755_06395 [Candidatus Peribacteraceae bacterium]|nr:hypothetical protein [Candidatus Peribacteraceae bacterium]
MPRYDFQCKECSYTFESELPFGSDESPPCSECEGETDRLIAPPAIHFKGAGFYNSDNRKPEPSKKSKDSTSEKTKETKDDTAAAIQESRTAPKAQKEPKKPDCSAWERPASRSHSVAVLETPSYALRGFGWQPSLCEGWNVLRGFRIPKSLIVWKFFLRTY